MNAFIPAVHTVYDVITHLVSFDTLSRLVTAQRPICLHEFLENTPNTHNIETTFNWFYFSIIYLLY